MKVDGLAVVLAIILLPIILVVTYYIQMQVDTIATENQYNTKLLNATYDAMSAFEINTANENLSSVADSLRSIILASNNIFLNTLATNLGMSNASKELLQPYIPTVLYTLYDGYYIYSPTEIPKIVEKTQTDENGITTTKGYMAYGDDEKIDSAIEDKEKSTAVYGDVIYKSKSGGYTIKKENAETETDYILKSYVQYSAQYEKGNKNVTIDYTLDNYLNIIGTIGDVYYTKTGYLIKDGLVEDAKIGNIENVLNTYNEYDAKNKILGLKTTSDQTSVDAVDSAYVKINGVVINSNFSIIREKINNKYSVVINNMYDAQVYLDKLYEEYHKTDDTDEALLKDYIRPIEYEMQNCKAVAYYISSALFSNWVYDNLGDLVYSDLKQISGLNDTYETESGIKDVYYNFNSNLKIFDRTDDPEDTLSNFWVHKLEVIKNSIKYNLNLSISAYCKMMGSNDYSMPIFTDEEWNKILRNISIVSFMQGWDCGLDIYNNYEIVSSTNNESTVTPDEIYYVETENFNNGSSTYHRIDCPYLTSGNYISFKSKEVKYDKLNNVYDHKNLACYTCINTDNYKERSTFTNKDSTDYYERISSLEDNKKKLAGYIALAKERQSIYKTNALPVSQGYKVFEVSSSTTTGNNVTVPLDVDLAEISQLQITIANTKSIDAHVKESILNLSININENIFNASINLDQKNAQTILLDVSKLSGKVKNNQIIINKTSPPYKVGFDVKSIKAIVRDSALNLSTENNEDKTPPTVKSISADESSITFRGSDIIKTGEALSGITGYMIKEDANKPSVNSSEWIPYTGDKITINDLKPNTTYYIFLKDASGNISRRTITTKSKMTLTKDNVEFLYNPNGWTNGNIKVTANYTDMSLFNFKYTLKITTDSPNNATKAQALAWTSASNGITLNKNQKVYAVLVDIEGNIGSFIEEDVDKIDTQKPTVEISEISTNSITFMGKDMAKIGEKSSGVTAYIVQENNTPPSANSPNWQSYSRITQTASGLTKETTYYIFVKDAAGNVSDAVEAKTGSIAATSTSNVNIKDESWSGTTATVSITTTEPGAFVKYKVGNGNWSNAVQSGSTTTVTTGTTVYAYLCDSSGQTNGNPISKIIVLTYSVAYNGNGATSGSMSNSSHDYGTAKKLTANGFSRTGYSFDGWNTKADGTGTSYSNGQSVINLSSINGSVVTLYARWKVASYTLAYNANGGSGSVPSSTTVNSGTTVNVNFSAIPTKYGYVFLGWSKSSSATTPSYKVGDTITLTGNTVLYAVWTSQSNTVAKIGNIYFTSLQEAINAVPKNDTQTTVTLLKSTTETISISSGRNVYLDVAGYTITYAGTGNTFNVSGTNSKLTVAGSGNITNSGGSDYKCIYASSGGSLNFVGTVTVTSATNSYTVCMSGAGTFTMSNGTISSTNSSGRAVYLVNRGTKNISGGTISNTSLSTCSYIDNDGGLTISNLTSIGELYINCSYANTCTISGGTYTALSGNETNTQFAMFIYVASGFTSNVSGGTFTAPNSGYSTGLRACVLGTLNITGGTYKHNWSKGYDLSGTYGYSSAIQVYGNSSGVVNMSGGTVEQRNFGPFAMFIENVTVNISGNTYMYACNFAYGGNYYCWGPTICIYSGKLNVMGGTICSPSGNWGCQVNTNYATYTYTGGICSFVTEAW